MCVPLKYYPRMLAVHSLGTSYPLTDFSHGRSVRSPHSCPPAGPRRGNHYDRGGMPIGLPSRSVMGRPHEPLDRSTARPNDSVIAWRKKLAETRDLPFVVLGNGPGALDALLDGCDRRGLPVFEKQHARPGDAPRRREWPEPELVGVLV